LKEHRLRKKARMKKGQHSQECKGGVGRNSYRKAKSQSGIGATEGRVVEEGENLKRTKKIARKSAGQEVLAEHQ